MMQGGMADMMKQLQGVQENMQKAQEELANLEVVGEAGGGLVKVTMTGKHQVRGVAIDDSLVGDDRDMLEDLIAAACNDALRRAEEATRDKMGALASGLGLPAGMNLGL